MMAQTTTDPFFSNPRSIRYGDPRMRRNNLDGEEDPDQLISPRPPTGLVFNPSK